MRAVFGSFDEGGVQVGEIDPEELIVRVIKVVRAVCATGYRVG